jgi:hypothetical protein
MFGRFSAAIFDYLIPLYWTVIIEAYVDLVPGNVDLRLFVKTVEKDSPIDCSSIDSERIHSPCRWLNNTGYRRRYSATKDSSLPKHRSGLIVSEMMAVSFLDMGLFTQSMAGGDLTGWDLSAGIFF